MQPKTKAFLKEGVSLAELELEQFVWAQMGPGEKPGARQDPAPWHDSQNCSMLQFCKGHPFLQVSLRILLLSLLGFLVI